MWGRYDDGELVAACHVGANLVPVEATPDDARAFAERALTRRRSVSTIVGPQDAGAAVLGRASPASWGRPRETRWDQPHLEIDGPPAGRARPAGAPYRRRPTSTVLYPACVAMYTEEVGVSPGGRRRRRPLPRPGHPADRAAAGRSPGSSDGRLVFKAEVACATPDAAQVQGVWVAAGPPRRGAGRRRDGRGGRAACRATSRPSVSLYVNDWNEPPGGPTSGSASARRRRSPPSCSDDRVAGGVSSRTADVKLAGPASSPSAASSTWSSRRSTSR